MRLDVLHQQVEQAADTTVFVIADDPWMIVNAGKNLSSTDEAPPRQQIEFQSLMQPPKGISFAVRVSSQPDIRHPSAADQFLQIETAKRSGSGGGGRFCPGG